MNDLFQISKVDPRKDALAASPYPHIFAFGDICLTSLNEVKGVMMIMMLKE